LSCPQGGRQLEEKELRGKRRELIERAKALVEAAKAANRALTDEENAECRKLLDEADGLKRQIEQAENEGRLADMNDSQGTRTARQDGAGDAPDNGTGEIRSLGEFLHLVRWDPGQLRAMQVAEGSSGGYLVPQQFADELLRLAPEQAIIRPRARVIPAGDPPDARVTIPALDQGSKGVLGGVTVNWIAEGSESTETEAKLHEIGLEPREVAGHTTVSDKLLRNAPAASALIGGLLRAAIAAVEDYAFLRGDGTGKPLGVLNSPGRLRVARNSAGKIELVDLFTMLATLLPDSWDRAVWIANQSSLPQLAALKDDAGNSVLILGDATKKLPASILGLPVLWTGKTPTLGAEGDLLLCDFGYYLVKDGSGPFVAASEHVHFKANKTVIKVSWNVDGQGWVREPLLLEDGSTKVSPFVVLK